MISERQLFFQHLAQTSEEPMAIDVQKAEGLYVYDAAGKEYMDLISGISVSNIGHRHPRVVSAIKEQSDRYLYTMVYGEYVQSPQVQLAKLLTEQLPADLDNVYFVNSGSEAVEGAIKLAKRYTGRRKVFSFNKAYHGSTHGALSLMGDDELKKPFEPLLPEIEFLSLNDLSGLESVDATVAAVIVETIQGEAGVQLPNKEYVQALKKKCEEVGALLILDEIQCGFGRTGTLFAFEQYDVQPDILCLAKGMGGGMPIGAFVASKKVMNVLAANPALGHITTFGGHPVSCVAALENLKVLLEERLAEGVEEKGNLFKDLLQHDRIKEVRGKGLLLAVELGDEDFNKSVITKCIEKGLLVDWFLFCGTALRIAPPLMINEEEIKKACTIILESIEEA